MSRVRLTIILFFCFTLISCAQLESAEQKFDSLIYTAIDKSIGPPLTYIEDSIRGYRVDFETIPAGAKLTCNGKEEGYTPKKIWFDLSEEVINSGVFNIENCTVTWASGARVEINAQIPLEQFPRNVYVIRERPADYPNAVTDKKFEREHLAHRQAQLEAAAGTIISVGSTLYQLSQIEAPDTNPAASANPGAPLGYTGQQSHGFQSSGAIQWNWVESTVQPINFSASSVTENQFNSNMNTFPAITPASFCKGAIVMGQCSGTLLKPSVQPYCAGKFINGACVGTIIMGGD